LFVNIRRGALTTLVAGASLVLAACTSASAPAGGASPAGTGGGHGGITIGFANPQDTQPVLQAFQQALTAAAARAGDHVIALNAALSVNQQVSDIQTLITDKVKAIIVFPLAGPALVPVLTQARNAGIKLIGYNALIPGSAPPKSAAPFDADLDQGIIVQGAKDAASYVDNALNGKGNVVGINIGQPVPSLDAFVANYKTYVTAGHTGVHWLTTAFDQTDSLSGGQTAMQDAITRYHGNINAVMAYTDESAIGAANALQQAGIKKTVIVGQQGNADGISALRAGRIQGDIDVQPWKQAIYALAMARDLVAGKSVPAMVEFPAVFITKANLSSYVPWATAISEISAGKISLSVSF
jgi:ribose transport system substrate-binding protein